MKRAFTLIEVLTVALIVLILAAIAYPVFFQVKARAKQTVCESNMHQVYLAIQLYENDYGEPPYLTSTDPYWNQHYIGGQLKCSRAGNVPGAVDYFVMAGFVDDEATNAQSKHWNDLLRACHEARGDAFPVAYDPNHEGKLDAYQAAGRRVILVRENGAVANVPFQSIFPFTKPPEWAKCSTELPNELQF